MYELLCNFGGDCKSVNFDEHGDKGDSNPVIFKLEVIEDTGKNICLSLCVGLKLLVLIALFFLLDDFFDKSVFACLVNCVELATLGVCFDIRSFLLLVIGLLLDEKNFLTLDKVFLLITEVDGELFIGVDGDDELGDETDTVAILLFFFIFV